MRGTCRCPNRGSVSRSTARLKVLPSAVHGARGLMSFSCAITAAGQLLIQRAEPDSLPRFLARPTAIDLGACKTRREHQSKFGWLGSTHSLGGKSALHEYCGEETTRRNWGAPRSFGLLRTLRPTIRPVRGRNYTRQRIAPQRKEETVHVPRDFEARSIIAESA